MNALRSYAPADAEQAGLLREFLARLEQDPRAWSRECAPSHLTASAVVLDRSLTSVLLVLHRKVGRWLQPGGHIDGTDAGLAAAALREAVEETGVCSLELGDDLPVRLDRHRAPCGVEHHLDVQFLVLAGDGADVTVSEESLDVAWWPVDALPEPAVPGLELLVAAGLSRAGQLRAG